MHWTKTDNEYLRNIRTAIDSDNVKIKEQIKQRLINNKYIIKVLNNKELEESEAEPDDYFGICILPYYTIVPVQSKTENFVCYETSFDEISRFNKTVKLQQITFHILCHRDNIVEKTTSLARHDLLAALIQDEFNYTTCCGPKMQLVSDRPGNTDNDYATRTLIFEQSTDSNIVKTRNGVASIVNKGIESWQN